MQTDDNIVKSDQTVSMLTYLSFGYAYITKTCLFKYTVNYTNRKQLKTESFQKKNSDIFQFLLKT